MKLRDKVAVVTGGGRGLGRGIALALAREGCDVVLGARTEGQLAGVAREVEDLGRLALPIVADVTSPGDIRRLIAEAAARCGGIDILVNNAGGSAPGDVVEVEEEAWRRCIDLNLTSTFLCSKHAIPHLRARGGGAIINIGSTRGMSGRYRDTAYGVAKAGIIQLTKCMALDFADAAIRVNCICPGAIATERHERLIAAWDDPLAFDEALEALPPDRRARYRALRADPEAARSFLGQNAPMGRRGTTGEVGRATVFLASDDASFVTGAILVVDGGRTAGS